MISQQSLELPHLPHKVIPPPPKSPIIIDRLTPSYRRGLLNLHVRRIATLRFDNQSFLAVHHYDEIREISPYHAFTPKWNGKPQPLVLHPSLHIRVRIENEGRLLLEGVSIE